MISVSEIKGSVDLSFTSGGKKVGDEQKQILILLGDFVETAVVHTELERAVLLANKKDRGTMRRTSRTYESSMKVVIDELSEGSKFRL